jgi:hypothetical protein
VWAVWRVAGMSSQMKRVSVLKLTYVKSNTKVTYMEKIQVYFRKEELGALRKAAALAGRSVAEVVRDAVRKVVLRPHSPGFVGIWDGKLKHSSVEHDSIYDEP